MVFQGCLEVSRGFGGFKAWGLHWRALLPNRLQIVGERVANDKATEPHFSASSS